jgi:2-oxoisovalerate dehydrogenase E2 component (dihydrolipoyl transacylase)
MAKFIFNLPDIGEGIAEAEIVAWHVKVGDRIEEDQPVADMMTDKATVEMESPVSGIVTAVAGAAGDVIPIGSMLVEVETDAVTGDDAVDIAEESDVTASMFKAPECRNIVVSKPINEAKLELESEPKPVPESAPAKSRPMQDSAKFNASPAVRARAMQLGVDLSDVKASGNHVRHADLDNYLSYNQGQGYRSPSVGQQRADVAIKVIGLRRRIAENMAASKRHIPHFTYVDEMDVTALEFMRFDLNNARGERPKLTMLPFLITAICKAVPSFPMINARYDDDAGIVTQHGAVHLGMAAQTDAGLVVPVLRNAQDWQHQPVMAVQKAKNCRAPH